MLLNTQQYRLTKLIKNNMKSYVFIFIFKNYAIMENKDYFRVRSTKKVEQSYLKNFITANFGLIKIVPIINAENQIAMPVEQFTTDLVK